MKNLILGLCLVATILFTTNTRSNINNSNELIASDCQVVFQTVLDDCVNNKDYSYDMAFFVANFYAAQCEFDEI